MIMTAHKINKKKEKEIIEAVDQLLDYYNCVSEDKEILCRKMAEIYKKDSILKYQTDKGKEKWSLP